MRLAHEIVKRIDLANSIWKKWDGQREVLLKSALCCLAPGTGKTKTGRLWVYVRDDRPFCGQTPPAAVYFFSPDRGGEHPARHMASFTGFLQADGYAGFEALFDTTHTPITEVACWAHCRRKFFDVWEATKLPVAREALDRIGALYAIEEKARFAPPGERMALTQKLISATRSPRSPTDIRIIGSMSYYRGRRKGRRRNDEILWTYPSLAEILRMHPRVQQRATNSSRESQPRRLVFSVWR